MLSRTETEQLAPLIVPWTIETYSVVFVDVREAPSFRPGSYSHSSEFLTRMIHRPPIGGIEWWVRLVEVCVKACYRC